jgi:Domain of unknown function (4846)
LKSIIIKTLTFGSLLIICYLFINSKQTNSLINKESKTIVTRFKTPKDYVLVASEVNSFGAYLQQLPLKPHGSEVHLYNGEKKYNQVAAAVINVDVGTKDLQQCADAVMRLRAEYLFASKQFALLHFNFTNGFNAQYTKWQQGYRIVVKGNAVSWVKTDKESLSYPSFKEYLQMVFTYAGTASLAKELKPVALKDMKIGDVFIKGGSPGHAVIIVNMASNAKTGKKLFMIAQSYMPAQDIHVLINSNNSVLSPWYELDVNATDIETPEWPFTKNQLMGF